MKRKLKPITDKRQLEIEMKYKEKLEAEDGKKRGS